MVEIDESEVERWFDVGELFFSSTDGRGVIRSGNSVFVRISGYGADELFGAPHNLVRHPDMPRAVFQLFWERLEAGRPVTAYVKNRAKDGSYYWVVASAVPTSRGLLSIRMKPTDLARFDAVRAIYTEVRLLERRLDGDGWPRHEGTAAARRLLDARIAELGYPDYDAFMRAMVVAEVRSREFQLDRRPDAAADGLLGGHDGRIGALARQCADLGHQLDEMFGGLGEYLELNDHLAAKTRYLTGLAEHISIVSLNAVLAASKLAGSNGPLSVIAHGMQEHGERSTTMVRDLAEQTGSTVALLTELSYKVALAKLQNEMAEFFVGELGGESNLPTASGALDELVEVLLIGGHEAAVAVDQLAARLQTMEQIATALVGELRRLRFSELNGRVEVARLADSTAFATLFADVQHQIESATRELTELQVSTSRASRFRVEQINDVLAALHVTVIGR